MIKAITRNKRYTIFLLLIFLSLLIPGLNTTSAQSGRRANPVNPADKDKNGEENPLLKVKTDEVLLSVTVRNQTGNLATGLSQRDFIVIEDGVRQEITSFNIREVPLNIVLLLDASGSLFTEMKDIREAAIRFTQQLRPIDQVSVIQFADKVELIQDWTSNLAEMKHAISWRYRPGEATHLWDAVYLAAEDKLAQVEGRKVMIILTDGVDSASKISRELALYSTMKSGSSVYVVSKASALAVRLKGQYGGIAGRIAGTKGQVDQIVAQLNAAEAVMNELAVKTGGSLIAPIKNEDLLQAYQLVADELKSQYILTYTPTNEQRNGQYRAVKVALSRPGLTVSTREGYVANKE